MLSPLFAEAWLSSMGPVNGTWKPLQMPVTGPPRSANYSRPACTGRSAPWRQCAGSAFAVTQATEAGTADVGWARSIVAVRG